MDRRPLRRHAHLPDFALISVERPLYLAQQRIRPRAARAVEPAVHDDVRLPDTDVCPWLAVVLCPHWRHSMGLLKLFRDNHRRRPYMEVHGSHLYTANNRRRDTPVPRPLFSRRRHDGNLRHASAQRKPPANELLLRPCDDYTRRMLSYRSNTRETYAPLVRRFGPRTRRRRTRPRSQRPLALQHLRIRQGDQTLAVGTHPAALRLRRPGRAPHRRSPQK